MAGKPDPFGKIRHPKKRAFLAAMANMASVSRAAEIARVDRDNHYLWLKKDPDMPRRSRSHRCEAWMYWRPKRCAGHTKALLNRYSTAGSAPLMWCRIQTA